MSICFIISHNFLFNFHFVFVGPDCSQREGNGLWMRLDPDKSIDGRASHAIAKVNDTVWVVGGYSFAKENSTVLMV